MEEIGKRLVWHYVPFTNFRLPFNGVNIITVMSTLLVMFILIAVLRLAVRRFAWIPGRGQMAVELLLGGFDSMVSSALQLKTQAQNRHFLPLISTLFIYVLLCNSVVLLPIPRIEEPTSDLNCTLALGLMSITYSMYCGFKAHGVAGYLGEMCGPMWHHEGKFTWSAIPGKLSALFFFPLHLVEELSRLISISFRLFGNITGAAIVVAVVSTLAYGLVIPLGLDAFLFIFEAAVQAFVFAMLTLMYIASAIGQSD